MKPALVGLLSACFVLLSRGATGQDVALWTHRGSVALGSPRVLIVVDSLAAQLATAGGERTIALALDAGGIAPNGPVARNWAQLSTALDAGPMEAITRLFGSRVVFAFHSGGLPLPSDWVVATRVGRDDAGRVLKALDAVHRGVVAGATVFSIERGSFQLCVVKQGPAGRVLVLGPGAGVSAGLFRSTIRALQEDAGADWFGSAWPVAEDGNGVPGGVLLRVAGLAGEPSVLFGRANDVGWSGVAIAVSALAENAPTWSAADARAVLDGAALGMIGSIDAASLAASPLAPFVGLDRRAAETVLGDRSCRGAVRLVTHERGRSDVELALETEPSRSAEADEVMRMLIAKATARPREAPDFGGKHPGALRSARLGGGFSDQLGRLVFGGPPAVRWRSGDDAAGERGMLVVSIGTVMGEAGALAGALDRLAGLEAGELVSAGRLEPGPIAAIVERAAGLERPVLEWTERIESIVWETRRHGPGRVKAEFEVILRGGG